MESRIFRDEEILFRFVIFLSWLFHTFTLKSRFSSLMKLLTFVKDFKYKALLLIFGILEIITWLMMIRKIVVLIIIISTAALRTQNLHATI